MVEKNIASSRERAKSYILEGLVLVNNEKIDKVGTEVPVDSDIRVKDKLKYVSRGGLKLEKAILNYNISCKDKICLDIGCSTGGFTDCMLQNGAKMVYAVDVGYGQIDYMLRNDDRVKLFERTNARYLTNDLIKDKIDLLTVDVSFISLKLLIPVIFSFLNENATSILLIKPQFEAGKGNVLKGGVVKDKKVHFDVISGIYDFLIDNNLFPINLDFSPIKGPKGNIEYLIIVKNVPSNVFDKSLIYNVVSNAHNNLNI